MIHGYDENYIEKAMINLGDMLEYAVFDCHYEPDDFFRLFIQSGLAESFAIGNPSIVAGLSGPERAWKVLEKTKNQSYYPTPSWREDRSDIFWCGWSLAYYQWYSRKSFLEIWESVSIKTMQKMYTTLHEADISKTVEALDNLLKPAEKKSISFLRKSKGFTQKELAEAAGLNICQVQRLEYGERKVENLSLKTALALADALGVKAEELE